MVLVFIFLVVMLSMLGATFRQISTTLRLEIARSQRVTQDQGCLRATARALAMLQTQGVAALNGSMFTYPDLTTTAYRHYQVTFTTDPTSASQCIVQVVPID
jgi:hypothetical protein